jgi:hypothetical protein
VFAAVLLPIFCFKIDRGLTAVDVGAEVDDNVDNVVAVDDDEPS